MNKWRGVLAIEGVSSDGRTILPGALVPFSDPVPVMRTPEPYDDLPYTSATHSQVVGVVEGWSRYYDHILAWGRGDIPEAVAVAVDLGDVGSASWIGPDDAPRLEIHSARIVAVTVRSDPSLAPWGRTFIAPLLGAATDRV